MTDLIVSILEFLTEFFSEHIQAYNFESETYNSITGGITSVVEFLTDVNFIIPLSDIVTIIMLTLGLRLFKFSVFGGNWLFRRLVDIIRG